MSEQEDAAPLGVPRGDGDHASPRSRARHVGDGDRGGRRGVQELNISTEGLSLVERAHRAHDQLYGAPSQAAADKLDREVSIVGGGGGGGEGATPVAELGGGWELYMFNGAAQSQERAAARAEPEMVSARSGGAAADKRRAQDGRGGVRRARVPPGARGRERRDVGARRAQGRQRNPRGRRLQSWRRGGIPHQALRRARGRLARTRDVERAWQPRAVLHRPRRPRRELDVVRSPNSILAARAWAKSAAQAARALQTRPAGSRGRGTDAPRPPPGLEGHAEARRASTASRASNASTRSRARSTAWGGCSSVPKGSPLALKLDHASALRERARRRSPPRASTRPLLGEPRLRNASMARRWDYIDLGVSDEVRPVAGQARGPVHRVAWAADGAGGLRHLDVAARGGRPPRRGQGVLRQPGWTYAQVRRRGGPRLCVQRRQHRLAAQRSAPPSGDCRVLRARTLSCSCGANSKNKCIFGQGPTSLGGSRHRSKARVPPRISR